MSKLLVLKGTDKHGVIHDVEISSDILLVLDTYPRNVIPESVLADWLGYVKVEFVESIEGDILHGGKERYNQRKSRKVTNETVDEQVKDKSSR